MNRMSNQIQVLLASSFLCVTFSFLAGCEPVYDAIRPVYNENILQIRNGVAYLPNQEEPFTGKVVGADLDLFTKAWYKHRDGYYSGGKREGRWTYWYQSGQKRCEGNYSGGKKEGRWTYWHRNGQKAEEGDYSGGNKEGQWTTWWEINGQKLSEGFYGGGEKCGVWTEWDRDGQVSSRERFGTRIKVDPSGVYRGKTETDMSSVIRAKLKE